MDSIKHSTLKPIPFFCSVIASKRKKDSAYLKRVDKLKKSNIEYLEHYSESFIKNNLEEIYPIEIDDQLKNDLLSLYHYRAKPFQMLRKDLYELNGGHEIARCPHCGVNTPSTFDHFLPKTIFPEFAIHPLNLTPCCSDCNGHKSNIWHEKGERACFNVYLDKEPKEQFLFCDVRMINDIPFAQYKIDSQFIEDKKLYALIEQTYKILHLIPLYNKVSSDILIRLSKEISNLWKTGSFSKKEVLDYLLSCYKKESLNDRFNVYSIALLENPYSRKYLENTLGNSI